jgi:Protein of unknown function (DUF2442)
VSDPRAVDVGMTDDELVIHLADGRTVSVPLSWFPRLLHASIADRADLRLIGEGEYINWPALNEDLSVEGLVRGAK